ncbi:hypothetical protein [Phyllobacterium myrsinacearum]|uniref:Uncharacterized protein n=1 Tax=Phyllobacterium myrsinacearum TaxID=28101 RepID=A0A839ENI8_9HYPH|nr:hypothetical protein [Phyllobacterium myrsinacearum]MBA8878986.1 hypothetical protein [Phyllobacterium myrsinacearum]
MPTLDLRTGKQEEETRELIRKDIEGYGPYSSSGIPWLKPQGESVPWRFTDDPGNGRTGGMCYPQTLSPYQTSQLSVDAAKKDLPAVKGPGNPPETAKEATPSFANELLKNFKAEIKTDARTEEEKTRTTTKEFGQAANTDTKRTNTYKETGKPFDGKYTVGMSSSVGKDGALSEGKDEDGFAQGSYKAGFGEVKASSGLNISDDWAGGNANITGKVGASAAVGVFKADGSLGKDGLAQVKGGVEALSAEAKAEAGLKIGTYKGSPTATLSGEIGASATLVEGKLGGGISITPRRIWSPIVHAYNGLADWAEWDSRLEELDNKFDWGFFVELSGSAAISAEASAKGEVGALGDGKVGARGKLKLGAGVGAGLGLGGGIVMPKK